ncbi:MAG: hypothetical protein AAB838_03660 [Patescibacteria group bacterium]
MGNIVQNVFEIPGEFLRVAHKQIVGLPDEKKLRNLVANDQKQAAVRISQIQQQLRRPLPEIKQKPKPLVSPAVRAMLNQSTQTGEMKIGGAG